jgi:hypothetical protein
MSSLSQGQNTSTILDILNKENLTQKILPIISPTNKSATSSDLEEMVEPQPAGSAANATGPEEQAANETAPVSGSETKNASELNETPSEQIPSVEQSQPLTNKSEELPPPIKNPGKNENEETVNKLVNKTQEGELPPVNVTVNKLVNKTQEGELPPVNVTVNNSLNEAEENPPVSQSDNSEENPPVSQSDNSEENPPSDNTGDKSDNVNNDNK